ncbi:transcriptional coactivator/pterin dehydratase [Hypoxylon sp. FL0543]|nr:transcriptional coactivator/pterin dehydratase [Hypoxylon sp. FL0543]
MYVRSTRPLLRCASTTVRTTVSSPSYGAEPYFSRTIVSSYGRLFSHQSRPTFTRSAAMATSAHAQIPHFSAGVDEPALSRALEPLLASAGRGGRWVLVPGGEGLERSFRFKTFAKTWVYNTTYIRWTTHNPKGLSAKDVELAAICDGLGRDFGEIIEETSGDNSCSLKQVADRAVTNAGDCCTPKK